MASAIEEQHQVSNDIGHNVRNISQGADKGKTIASQAAEEAVSLQSVSAQLKQVVSGFKL